MAARSILPYGFQICYNLFFFFNDTATTEIYTLSLHDALPILDTPVFMPVGTQGSVKALDPRELTESGTQIILGNRSEEHTSELQSQSNLVCRLLLEKKKKSAITPQEDKRKEQVRCWHLVRAPF